MVVLRRILYRRLGPSYDKQVDARCAVTSNTVGQVWLNAKVPC